MSRSKRRAPVELSDLQLAVMDVLWEQGLASVADVVAALPAAKRRAVTTVATTLQRLERRGVVQHEADGRTFLYRAALPREEVRRSMVGALLRRLFEGDPALLLSHLLTEQQVDEEELRRLRRLLEKGEESRG